MRRRGLLVFAAAIALSASAAADDEVVDWDERIEGPSNPTYSKFWSGDRFPNDEAYQDKIEMVRTLWRENKRSSHLAAMELLERAAEMEPSQVAAYAWLARIAHANSDWERCAAALDEIAALNEDPPPDEFKELATADQRNLLRGTCHALAGDYETAVERFKAIVSAGTASSSLTMLAKQRLAETFMALGRLEESIETLEQLFKRRRYDPGLALLMAVAYDRNEQIAKAVESHAIGKKQDPNYTTLSSASRVYIPPEDEYFFLGIAYGYDTARSQTPFATYYFREYLHHAKDGPWARRAGQHLESTLSHQAGDDLRLYGTAGMDEDKARAAIAAADSEFQDCVSEMPRALFRLRITRLPKQATKTKPKRQSKDRERRRDYDVSDALSNIRASPRIRKHTEQVKALLDRIGKPMPESEDIARVTRCLEAAGVALKLPAPTGGSGTYVMAEFRVIAR